MQNGTISSIHSAAGDTGSIQKRRAVTILKQAATQTIAALELMVHVTEDNQIRAPFSGHPVEGQRQITISPVDGRTFPVPTAGTVGIRPKSSRTTVSEHDQGLIRRNLTRCGNNP